MEVTQTNFPAVLQEVQSLLARCCLVAFDCEFTGLRGSGVREDWEDTPSERYCKLKEGCSQFALIQFGLCFFVKDESADLKYEVFPFNFYLFPSYPLGRKVPQRLDHRFLCQPSSLLMLAKFGLDFNKWIREGVPYLSESDEVWWRGRRKEDEQPSQDELNHFLGFSQVFKMIVESKVPLVGHSILLDVLHTYTHFIGDLPVVLVDFKTELNRRLTRLYDTQLMCDDDNIRPLLGPSTSLANVYGSLSELPSPQITTELPASCSHYTSGKHLHEAAYDAYISGCAFVIMARILGGDSTTDLFEAAEAYTNRIYLYNCEGADSFNLTGSEDHVPREHVFYLTFPKEVTTDDIKNLFSPFGGCRVWWINDTSARVSLHHRKKAKEAYKALAGEGSMCGKPFTITPYELHTCTTATKTMPLSQAVEQAMECQSTLLGKRKIPGGDGQTEENVPSSSKMCMFEESTEW